MHLQFQFRPTCTDDEANYNTIVRDNEYRLPDSMDGAVVIDVGAHIGCFAAAALQRGAEQVFSYEAEIDNFNHLIRNLAPAIHSGHSVVSRAAVWRSDGAGPKWLHFTPSENTRLTGGGNVLWGQDGQAVPTIPLDEVLEKASHGFTRRIHLLKLDCEGSEWPILFTATSLAIVDKIIGEFHEIGGLWMGMIEGGQAHRPHIPAVAQVGSYTQYTRKELQDFLLAQGFKIANVDTRPTWIGHFWAQRDERVSWP